jgi:hypothetical protein
VIRFERQLSGEAFRATVTGHVNATPPPSGHFAGYAVGIRREN